MAFFKRYADGLSDDLGRLGLGPDKKSDQRKDEPTQSHASTRDGPGGDPYQGYSFGQPSPQPYPGQYQSPPPDAGSRQPPPYTPPADKPPIPSGWTPRWDEGHQRWYCAFPYLSAAGSRADHDS